MEATVEPNQSNNSNATTPDELFSEEIDFHQIVDPANWKAPSDYFQTMPKITREIVSRVVISDRHLRRELREEAFPQLLRSGDIQVWGKANSEYLQLLKRKKLYTGQVVAADGTLAKYETLSLVGAQIAVSDVTYQGHSGQWVTNITQWGKELPRKSTVKDIVEALKSRGKKMKNKLNNLFLHTLLTYKEREVLVHRGGPEMFKLIQGTVFPYEMLSGSGTQNTMLTCLSLLEQMIDDGSYAAIVSNTAYDEQLALGLALDAGEYIVINNGYNVLQEFAGENFDAAHYSKREVSEYGGLSEQELFTNFQNKYGRKVVQGVLRAHPMSKPYIFYCNEDRLDEAVHILLADASHTGPRGFPLLLDLADQYCSGVFKASEYLNIMNAEFSRASGGSAIYRSEHSTRDYSQGS